MRFSWRSVVWCTLVAGMAVGCSSRQPYIPGYSEATQCQAEADHDGAIAQYERFLKDNPNTPLRSVVLYELGQCYEAKGDKAKATDSYQKIIDAEPESSWAGLARTRMQALKEAK